MSIFLIRFIPFVAVPLDVAPAGHEEDDDAHGGHQAKEDTEGVE